MGKVEWAVYTPEDVNWEARSNVEKWERKIERDPLVKKTVKLGALPGFLFFLVMTSLLLGTYFGYVR